MRRKRGTGTLFQQGDRWIFSRSFMIRGRRVRRSVSATTPEEAEAKGQDLQPGSLYRQRHKWALKHLGDYTTAQERRQRSLDYTERVIRIGRMEGWAADHMARVIVATLTPSRIRAAIFGPCAYCGSWFANQVDHVIPTFLGGPDTPENRVSACRSCNSRKAHREATWLDETA